MFLRVKRIASFLLLTPILAWAGAYRCIDSMGGVLYSPDPCARGEKQVLVGEPQQVAGTGIVHVSSGPNGQFYASIRLNGVAARAIVDTGASGVTISTALAKRAGLMDRPYKTITADTANGKVENRLVTADSVELGSTVVKPILVAVGPDMGPVEALLGMDFLKHYEVHVANGQMTLRPLK
jgi:aspartyl protease family protein